MMRSVRQAAERLGVKPGLVYQLVAARRIAASRVGIGRGVIRISEDALDEYVRGVTFGTEGGEGGTKPPAARPSRLAAKYFGL